MTVVELIIPDTPHEVTLQLQRQEVGEAPPLLASKWPAVIAREAASPLSLLVSSKETTLNYNPPHDLKRVVTCLG